MKIFASLVAVLIIIAVGGVIIHSHLVPIDVVVAPTKEATTTESVNSTTTVSIRSSTPVVQPALPLPAISLPNDDEEPASTTATGTERFVIAINASSTGVIDSLIMQGFIEDKAAFTKVYASVAKSTSTPGAYRISKSMTATQIATVLKGAPYMKWVVIPEGLRKEEIAELLAKNLGWSTEVKNKWINTYTQLKYDYVEGVYFPDTYLIPVDEAPIDVANRIIAKFNEKFGPYIGEFNKQNIKWTTGLTLASIVQREAANKADMPLIAGILWNRLDQNIALGVDATLQYIRGNTGDGWWAPISVEDKKLGSPYNTYINKGLPPHPIANPGLSAIDAVLKPASTTCLYYLHDKNKVTRCAATYQEHQANIEKYLK